MIHALFRLKNKHGRRLSAYIIILLFAWAYGGLSDYGVLSESECFVFEIQMSVNLFVFCSDYGYFLNIILYKNDKLGCFIVWYKSVL